MVEGVDLHTHSNFSDGTMSPKELVKLAHDSGLTGISITDHDAIGAFREGYEYAVSLGCMLIPGIEMSTEFQNESIHVLGYSYDPNSEILIEACLLHRKRREARNRNMIDLLEKKGMKISYDEVVALSPEAHTYGRPHIAHVMVQKGYVESIQDAFKKYLGTGKSCYVAGEKWATSDAVEIIHQAKGYAILAHPHLISRFQRVRELMKLPFDGLEGYYAQFPLRDNKRFISLAESQGLLITGGSDFHGTIKPHGRLGSSVAPDTTVKILYTRLQEHLA